MEEEDGNLNEDDLQKIVKEIRAWMKEELPDARKDDHTILRFLQGCKGRVETAKTKLKNDYHFRRNTPQWFANRDPEGEGIKEVLAAGVTMYPDNFRNENGQRMIFSRPNFHDASLSADLYFKAMIMCNDEAMEDDPSIAKDGVIAITDFKNTSFKHMVKKLMLAKNYRQWSAGSLMRMQELHFINFPSFATYSLNFIKGLLKEKLKNRIIIHPQESDLKNYFDPKYLPDEYGGTAGSTEDMARKCYERIVKKKEWFLDSKNFL